MKVVHLTPGSGDSFYCQNCVRDLSLVRALGRLGVDVTLAPMYLPLNVAPDPVIHRTPVFYGAINVYLDQKLPGLGRLRRALHRWLDARPLLEFASRRAGSTDAEGLEDMTASMLRGEEGRQADELDRLVAWLREDGPPDVVHLSNALLLGVARRLRSDLGCAVVCSLQDEDVWLDAMEPSAAARLWTLLADRAREVDLFIAVSRYFAGFMAERVRRPAEHVRVVYPGVVAADAPVPLPSARPAIGYFARMSPGIGLDVLADAFLLLRGHPRFSRLRLRAAGGCTSRDRAFVDGVRRKADAAGAGAEMDIIEEFRPAARAEFLRSLSVLSVPSMIEDGGGLYLLEALAQGVPVVQPRRGAFSEIVEDTGGGILYEGDTPEALAGALAELLDAPDRLRALGRAGHASVRERYRPEDSARATLAAYQAALELRTGRAPVSSHTFPDVRRGSA